MRMVQGIAIGALGLSLILGGCGGKKPSPSKSKSQTSSQAIKKSQTKPTSNSKGTQSSSKPPSAPSTTGTTTQTGNPTGTNAQAATLFQQKCQVCHGPGGAGASAPKLSTGLKTYFQTQASLQSFIQQQMPFNSPGSLSSSQASALARYIWSMQSP